MRREPELLREFGQYVRDQRQRKGLGLRQVARAARMSATYLSQIERGEQRWPTEQKVLDLANALAHSSADLLCRAGRLSSEVMEILKTNPQQYTALLEAMKDLTLKERDRVITFALLTVRSLLLERVKKKAGHKSDDISLWQHVGADLAKARGVKSTVNIS